MSILGNQRNRISICEAGILEPVLKRLEDSEQAAELPEAVEEVRVVFPAAGGRGSGQTISRVAQTPPRVKKRKK